MFLKKRINTRLAKSKALYEKRINNAGTASTLKKEVKYHLQLANLYKKAIGHKKFPNASFLMQEHWRIAASLDNAEAQYLLSAHKFEEGKFWQSIDESYYESAHVKQYLNDAYKEAHTYANAAVEQEHILAKRVLGLAYINAWGVEEDKDRGLKLIVDSIEQAKAWGKATKIFEELGLNDPAVFASLMSMRKN